jgi:hypothetical protein
MKRINASAGMPLDLRENTLITFDEMRPGCYDVKARLADMDAGHVEASLCFPTMPRFCGQTFAEAAEKELALACVGAYNDFMVEEWCGQSGGRLIPLCLVPLWVVELAADEVRRNADRGVRAVAFSEIPYHLGLPSIHSGYWDPLWRACAETRTSVNMHIGSSSKMPTSSRDAPNGVGVVLTFANSATSLSISCSPASSCASLRSSSPTPKARSAGSPTSSSSSMTSGSSTAPGPASRTWSPSHRPPITTVRSTAASSAIATARGRWTLSARTTCCSR